MKIKIQRLNEIQNLREKIYDIIKKIIISQELSPGDKIDEDFLAKQLGVSRTPVRESLCRLDNEGIIKIIPRRGAFVVKHSKESIIEILLIREVLEGLAVRLAAAHIDGRAIKKMKSFFKDFSESNIRSRSKSYTQADLEFHSFLIKESKNNLLISLMNILNDHIQMLRLRTVALKGRPEQSLSEHLKIIEALQKRDPFSAELLMREHIKNVKESILKSMKGD